MQSVRQKKMASLLKEAMSEIFMREGAALYGNNVLVSIMEVVVTPDVSIAKYYVSVFNAKVPEEIVEGLNLQLNEIRRALGNKLKKHLRKIPEIAFYLDETIEQAQKMDALFNQLKKDNPE